MGGRMVSPNEMLAAANDHMLDGRSPNTPHEWALVMNFVAANVDRSVCEDVCVLFRAIYKVPLSERTIRKIARFQNERRGE